MTICFQLPKSQDESLTPLSALNSADIKIEDYCSNPDFNGHYRNYTMDITFINSNSKVMVKVTFGCAIGSYIKLSDISTKLVMIVTDTKYDIPLPLKKIESGIYSVVKNVLVNDNTNLVKLFCDAKLMAKLYKIAFESVVDIIMPITN